MAHDRITRPGCEQAHSFVTCTCGDPGCGLHVIAERKNGEPICEIVIGRKAIREILTIIHEQGLDLE